MSSLSKIIAGVLLAAGLVLAFVAWRLASQPSPPPPAPASPVATQASAPAEPPAKRYPVVVAAAAIPAGTRIDGARMLKVDQWQVALSGSYSSPAPLQGAYARVDIAAGDPLLPSMLAQGLGRQLKPGERAVAIAVDEVVGGGNRIAPGDLVDVFFLLEKGVEIQAGQARLLQSRVRVLAYGTASVDGPEDKGTLPGPPGQPARTAVLAVPVEQVSELLLAGRSGRLQLALRPVGDDGGPDTQLFAQRGAVLPPRPDLTPEQRALLQSGPNRAYAGESLAQLEGTTPAAKPAAVRATGGGGGRSVEILRGDKSERVRY
ncbi:Flp pilus assembly protein CpaB [Achromobacter xylosoxidans]|uniref:Flp pilus assembly protein CpaB n=1 Tax=Alcaligenes xylosoxydans xylosoxydans TaxID=85698 RepID=UPI000A760274|nr:Flp pilus assembly protein CpaB [Achromobacter xylosoxidans]PWV41319.1 Flp pilus assembly protein CpaB [Achromobacter xylosoxidans]